MQKKKIWAAVGLGLGLSLSAMPALAADLSNGNSQTCTGIGVWHFVNNQTGGAPAGTLSAEFLVDGSTTFYSVGPSKVNASNQQFLVFTEGNAVLVDASTNLPGRLVLSDFTCDTSKKPKK